MKRLLGLAAALLLGVVGCQSNRPPGVYVSPGQSIPDAVDRARLDPSHTVYLRAGRHELATPLLLSAEDSGLTLAAAPGQHPILDAGRVITEWTPATINNRPAWSAPAPDEFRSLFVNGHRAPRPRLPKLTGTGADSVFRVERAPGVTAQPDGRLEADPFQPTPSFTARPGQVDPAWSSLTDIEVVILHFWQEERSPIASFDPATRNVTLARPTAMTLRDDHTNQWGRYYLDNVREALTDPGEWYWDRAEQRVYYLPRPGETLANTHIVGGRGASILEIHDAHNITLRGLTLRNTDWRPPNKSASSGQTAEAVPGVLLLQTAKDCLVTDCTVEHVGGYGVELRGGCTDNTITGNTVRDTAAGGIRLGGGDANSPESARATGNRITWNHVHTVGRVFHSGAGILVQNAAATDLSHNHVHDGYQMGVAVGWVWGYGPSASHDNHIEYNHIHDFGQRWLSDIGAIYTLGKQPGTTIRHNLIHDINAATYVGCGIYPDEGTSNVLIEHNTVHDVSHFCFHQHYGADNVVRDNTFAFGGAACVEIARAEDHNSAALDHNVLLSRGSPLYSDNIAAGGRRFVSDHNTLWDTTRTPPQPTSRSDLAAWQQGGHGQRSTVADPRLRFDDPRGFLIDAPAREH